MATLYPRDTPLRDRFLARVSEYTPDECWLWTGQLNAYGYGLISANKKRLMAHRVGYELLVGPIPEGLEIDHLCRVRACVNPAHLEPVEHSENMFRVFGDACPKGHTDFTYHTVRGHITQRNCRECQRVRDSAPEVQAKKRAYKARKRAEKCLRP